MTGPVTSPAPDELSAYGALLRRRWRLVAAGVLAGLLLPGLYVLVGPKTYTSTTSVLVTATGTEDPAALQNGETSAEINLDTEAEIATSIVVARNARQRIGTDIPPEDLIEDHVEVEVPPNSAVLEISYDASTPEEAKAGAQAFANAYLANRRQRAKATVQQRVKTLQGKIDKLTAELESVTRQLSAVPAGSSDFTYAEARRDLLTERISALGAQAGALSTTTITPGNIISGAQLPTAPSSPIVPLYLAGGLLLGAIAGLGGAVLRDRADTRVRHASDVERLVRLPVLMEMPGKRELTQPSLLPPRSRPGQGFHGLSHSLGAALGHGNHVVLVTGASPGPGTSTVATNLAATLARTGSPTVLVCADLQSVASTWMLGLEPSPGLSDILLHGTRVSAVEQRPVEPSRLRVVAPGMDTEIASEQLQTQAMERLIGELRQSATYIVLEAPSTSESADAQALADLSDVAVVVVEMPRAEREQVREGVRRLDRVGAAVLGAVVVPALEEPPALRQSQRLRQEQQLGSHTVRPETAPMPAIGTRTAPSARDSGQDKLNKHRDVYGMRGEHPGQSGARPARGAPETHETPGAPPTGAARTARPATQAGGETGVKPEGAITGGDRSSPAEAAGATHQADEAAQHWWGPEPPHQPHRRDHEHGSENGDSGGARKHSSGPGNGESGETRRRSSAPPRSGDQGSPRGSGAPGSGSTRTPSSTRRPGSSPGTSNT